jgi:hypothetical protein
MPILKRSKTLTATPDPEVRNRVQLSAAQRGPAARAGTVFGNAWSASTPAAKPDQVCCMERRPAIAKAHRVRPAFLQNAPARAGAVKPGVAAYPHDKEKSA